MYKKTNWEKTDDLITENLHQLKEGVKIELFSWW